MEVVKTPSRIHPLVATAAVAVTLVSLVGVAAITGLLPTSSSNNAPQQAMSDTTAPQSQQAMQQAQNNMQAAPQVAPKPNYAAQPQQSSGYGTPAPVVRCSSCGEVQAVRAIQHTPKASGVGIVAGAVLGGVLGNQIGNGNGRTLATVAGAGAGGYAGNEVEKRTRTTTTYVVDVRMENGSIRSFPQSNEGWRVGDQVRVVNGHLTGRG
ncbi:glycine zipper 2TM domain-containing protein [Herbaspirillum rhizosphaerae]|uniref:glycine zipper 2TM domain-containing protein n=1 Tax=Herbaspirillum rhizosphaerae TaxID=346179 RepID=UPI00067AD3F4|nr:glycine zipper 2TM domain-containing protein [Herbaspirillum rhizosphaerae]